MFKFDQLLNALIKIKSEKLSTNFGIAIHGGAGTILRSKMTPEKEQAYKEVLTNSIETGYQLLKDGKSSIESVTAAIAVLENSPLFNAGKGSVFNAKGKHEMDASIMDGASLNAGAVAAIENIKNPIFLAKAVLDHSDHVLLIGEGANEFAARHGFSFEDHDYFHDEYRFKQWKKVQGTEDFQLDHADDKPYLGTVGAVALDKNTNLAAGTSTGGMTNKKFGRVGDSPIIGAGTYADNETCAVSCTGSGEYFMRAVTAYDISCLMKYKGLSLEDAGKLAIHNHLLKIGGDGGVVSIDAKGNISMPFNTEGMYRACKNQEINIVAIYK